MKQCVDGFVAYLRPVANFADKLQVLQNDVAISVSQHGSRVLRENQRVPY